MWLITLIDKLFCFVPRPIIIAPDEGGYRVSPRLRLRGGVKVSSLDPGWYLWLPLFQKAEKMEIRTQVKDLRAQSVWTSDGHDITISGAVRYKITDWVAASLEVFNLDDNISVIGLAAIHEFAGAHTLEQCREQAPELVKAILDRLRDETRGWGVKIEKVYLTDTGDVMNIRLLQNKGD